MPTRSATRPLTLALLAAGLSLAATCDPPNTFVNWENHPVHGLEITPDGTRLLVTNTPDDRIEVFDLTGPLPANASSIPVGLDPVSVRALDDATAWVVNQVSDSVSIVDLASGNVIATLATGDEPADVVFAGTPRRAFVSVSEANSVEVRDPANPQAAPQVVAIAGESPRALATDGTRVFAALFESGNGTTILHRDLVSDPSGPYGGQNPPPNAGAGFSPPLTPGLTAPPPSSLVVRKDAGGRWRDANGADWSALVTWDVLDHDVAVIPASNPSGVSYVSGLMTVDMALGVTASGRVTVVGTEAGNQVRFEPNVRSKFVRVLMASFDPGTPGASVVDLNPHLTYTVASVAQNERDKSLADPRSVVWSSTDARGYVAGMGSSNVVAIDANGARLGRVDVGQGPASLALDEARGRLYVLNRFEATISVVDVPSMTQLAKIPFHDPTPAAVKTGRPMLYDAHATSGLGQVACASCHVDGRIDPLAWDLGDPAGQSKPFDQTCRNGENCGAWHPVKGPLTTQTLVGIVGTEPLHWRGDRADLAAFAGAFVSLLGDDAQPTAQQLQDFENLAATLRFAPNPSRNLDGTVKNTLLANGGNPAAGQSFFRNTPVDRGSVKCVECHAEPLGTNGQIIAAATLDEPQSIKIPQLRNLYQKTGFSIASLTNTRGFGFGHDGADATLIDFFHRRVFEFAAGAAGEQQRRDIEAFMFSFSTDVHPAIGQQVTLDATNKNDSATLARVNQLLAIAATNQVGAVVKGRIGGLQRGAYYLGNGRFQTDRASEQLTSQQLVAGIGAGSEGTLTIVPYESRIRIGIDRDGDGRYDRDELDQGRDPANPNG